MSCGESSGGDFKDNKPRIEIGKNGDKFAAKLENKAAENRLIEILAGMAGINVKVATDRLSNHPTLTGEKSEIEKVRSLLEPT